jgi:hypothetical protein
MAFCADRGDDDWEAEAGSAEEDALFVDEADEEADELMADLFSVEAADVDALDMVERLSWDATSEDSSEEEDEVPTLALPALLPIQVSQSVTEADDSLQWSLISPCSEASSPRGPATATLSPLTRLSLSSPVRKLRFFEPEHEPADETTGKEEDRVVQEEIEEVEPFDPETVWSPDASSVLASPPATNPFAMHEPAAPPETNHSSADDNISESDSEDESDQARATSSLRPSLLPRVPAIARWRRQKARTCSGAGSAGMPTALSLATFKTRTRSLSRARKQSVDEEDDGDFSSDDEGYTPELHRRRASETEPLGACQWRRARHTSLNFASHRLSVSVSMSPAMMTKRLQDAKSKINSGLQLLRSGSSASTVASEESYLDSPACEEIKSAPAGVHREPSIFSDAATFSSLTSAASTCTMDADQNHPSRQQQLRAGMFKAAGIINAASAEAARKLKSRGFRAPHLPRQKTTASETEEEDPDIPVKATSTAP